MQDDETPLVEEERRSGGGGGVKGWFYDRFYPEHDWRYYVNPKNSALFFLLLLLIVVGTLNRVFFKCMTNAMPNYPYFLSQLTTVVYLPLFWPVVWYLILFTDKITKEQRQFPWWKFVVMGLFDAIAGVFMTIGGNHVTGPIQLLLTQSAIPFTMVFSWVVSAAYFAWLFHRALSARYKWNHVVGALVILAGIVVSLAPKLFGHQQGKASVRTTPGGVLIFELGMVPLAMSAVYKEIAFKGADLDVYYVNAWVATWQLVIGILLAPITSIPGVGDVEFKDIPRSIWWGARCLVGINSQATDDCEWAWIRVLLYISANVAYNVIILLVIKYGSAALLYVASAVILPAANICFTFTFIMGKGNATHLSIFDICGLVIILIGLFFYRALAEQAKKPPEPAKDEEGGEEDPLKQHPQ